MSLRRFAATAIAALALAPTALAGGPTMSLGVAEDNVRTQDPALAQARMDILKLSGFDAVRVTSIWVPPATAPSAVEATILHNVAAAASLAGLRVYLSVYNSGSRVSPTTPELRAQFAQYAAAVARAVPTVHDITIGNEPNLNRFWLPQFNADGSNAASAAYLALLAQTYDALKAVSPTIRVIGGALAARGNDRPGTSRDTHSPVVFLRDLGGAYRASGRTAPIMDALALHPYPGNSSISPATTHPGSTTLGIADYDHLVSVLRTAFDGTGQAGSSLPIVYEELGIESTVPRGKSAAYTGTEPLTTKPVPEQQQAFFYAQAAALAFCQPTVEGLLFFHSADEPALGGWQSGVFYADGATKSSLPALQDALRRARGGSIARCDGLELAVKASAVRFPTAREIAGRHAVVSFRCDLDCAYVIRVRRAAGGAPAAAVRGYSLAGRLARAPLPERLRPGSYAFELSLSQPVNPAVAPTMLSSTTLHR